MAKVGLQIMASFRMYEVSWEETTQKKSRIQKHNISLLSEQRRYQGGADFLEYYIFLRLSVHLKHEKIFKKFNFWQFFS